MVAVDEVIEIKNAGDVVGAAAAAAGNQSRRGVLGWNTDPEQPRRSRGSSATPRRTRGRARSGGAIATRQVRGLPALERRDRAENARLAHLPAGGRRPPRRDAAAALREAR